MTQAIPAHSPCCLTLAGILHRLAEQRLTGRLVLRGDEGETAVYFVRGQPVFAERGRPELALGRLLLRKKRITGEQYSQAVHMTTEQRVDQEEMRFGEALVRLGLLSAPEVYDVLSEQVIEKIVDCFRYTSLSYEVCEGKRWLRGITAVVCPSLPALVVEGLRRHLSSAEAEFVLSTYAELRPTLEGRSWWAFVMAELSNDERSLLERFDGTRDVTAVAEGVNRRKVAYLLAAMLTIGKISLGRSARQRTARAAKPPIARRQPAPTAVARIEVAHISAGRLK